VFTVQLLKSACLATPFDGKYVFVHVSVQFLPAAVVEVKLQVQGVNVPRIYLLPVSVPDFMFPERLYLLDEFLFQERVKYAHDLGDERRRVEEVNVEQPEGHAILHRQHRSSYDGLCRTELGKEGCAASLAEEE